MSTASAYLRAKLSSVGCVPEQQLPPAAATQSPAAAAQQQADAAAPSAEPVVLTMAFLKEDAAVDASTGSVLLEVGEHPAKHRIAVTISETAPGFATVPKYGAASCAHRSCVFVTPGASAAAPKIAPAQAAPPGSPTAGRASKVQRVTRSAASARPVSIPAAPAAAPSPPQQQPPPFPPPSPHSPAAGAAAAAGAPFPSPGAPPSAPPALPAVSLRLCARSLSLHDECAEVLSLAASGGLPTSAVRRVYHLQNPALYEKYVRGLQYAATVSSAQAWPPAGGTSSAGCHCPLPAKRTASERLLFHGSHHACIASILLNGFDSGHDGGLIWFADQPSYSLAYCGDRMKRHVDAAVSKRVVEDTIRLAPGWRTMICARVVGPSVANRSGTCTLFTIVGGQSRHVLAYPEWVIVFDPNAVRVPSDY